MSTVQRNAYLQFGEALQQALSGTEPAVEWLVPLLDSSEEDTEELFRAADKVRAEHVGDAVHLRGLIEFSNYCRRNCAYCGLRRGNAGLSRYRLEPEAMIDVALQGEELGYRSVVLQSGEDTWYTSERLAKVIRGIKDRTDLAVTLSVGEREKDVYRNWRDAGADRYLLRIETTEPELFTSLHPDDNLEKRKACLYSLRDIGYQLGSGVMIGLPGQTAEMLARDVIWLHELGAEMIGVGPFIPHHETPLHAAKGGALEGALRLVAVLRLVFPDAHLPATTAMGSLHPLGREKALQAGANVVMPNITPVEFRSKYELYPGKICLGDDSVHCRHCITGRITSIGRTIATDHGHVQRIKCLSG